MQGTSLKLYWLVDLYPRKARSTEDNNRFVVFFEDNVYFSRKTSLAIVRAVRVLTANRVSVYSLSPSNLFDKEEKHTLATRQHDVICVEPTEALSQMLFFRVCCSLPATLCERTIRLWRADEVRKRCRQVLISRVLQRVEQEKQFFSGRLVSVAFTTLN